MPCKDYKKYLRLWCREQWRALTCAIWMSVQRPGETKDWQSVKGKAEATFLPFPLMGRPGVLTLCCLAVCSGSSSGVALKPRKLFMHLGGKREEKWTQVRTSFTTITFKAGPPRCEASVSHSGLSALLCSDLSLVPQCQSHSHWSQTQLSPSSLCLLLSSEFSTGTLSFPCSSLYFTESPEQVPQPVWK